MHCKTVRNCQFIYVCSMAHTTCVFVCTVYNTVRLMLEYYCGTKCKFTRQHHHRKYRRIMQYCETIIFLLSLKNMKAKLR